MRHAGKLLTAPARDLSLIFALALVLRAGYALGVYLAMGPDGLLEQDSRLFLRLGEMFLQHGDFVRQAAVGVTPETERMPLYIVWLAAHQAISGTSDPLFPALTQGVLDALACVLIARTARLLDPRLCLVAGLFAACNPTQILVASTILTDSVFYLFVCLALYAAIAWFREPGWRMACLLGIALALALATRVSILLWLGALVLMLPAASVMLRRFRWAVLGHVALVVVLALALQAPILARNLSEYGTPQLTSQGGAHWLLWIVPLVQEAADGTPYETGAARMNERLAAAPGGSDPADPFAQSRVMSRLAGEALAELGVGPIVKAWAIGAAINLFSPASLIAQPMRALPRTGFYGTAGDSKLEKIVNFLFRNDNPTYAWVLLVTGLGTVILRFAQLAGLGMAFRGRGRDPAESRFVRIVLGFLLLWVAYVLVVHGPIASAKYRLGIEPAAAIAFAYFATGIRFWWRPRRR